MHYIGVICLLITITIAITLKGGDKMEKKIKIKIENRFYTVTVQELKNIQAKGKKVVIIGRGV